MGLIGLKKMVKLCLLAGLYILLSSVARADGTESAKQINIINVLQDGGILVAVLSPGASANCDWALLAIAANSPAKNSWLSLLLTAKTSKTPVNIAFTGSGANCVVTSVSLQ